MSFLSNLNRLGRLELAASLVVVVLMLLLQSVTQAAIGVGIRALDGYLMSGMTVENGARIQGATMMTDLSLIIIGTVVASLLAGALAMRLGRGMFADAEFAAVATLVSLVALALSLLSVLSSGALRPPAQSAWITAATLTGLLAGLPIGGGEEVRSTYSPGTLAGLGGAVVAVTLAVFIVPFARTDPASGKVFEALGVRVEPLPMTAPPVFHPVAPSLDSPRPVRQVCRATAMGMGHYGEGTGPTEEFARSNALRTCGDRACTVSISSCQDVEN